MMNEVIHEFLLETSENLAQLDLDLVALEQEPGSREMLTRVFRTLHTIKGSAGFLGLRKLQAVAHAAENLLSRLTTGELTFNKSIAGALLLTVDAIRRVLRALEATEDEGDDDHTALLHALEELAGELDLVVPQEPAGTERTPAPEPPPPTHAEKSPTPAPPAVFDAAIRVNVDVLNQMMNLVGELVLARNQVLQCGSRGPGPALQAAVQRLNGLTTELQTSVMKTRLQAIGTLWGKFPRLVRDLAVDCGKQVRFVMEGSDTELDRTILEAIRDPLTHMLRNAVDHGIEAPAERRRRGKPSEGQLALAARHEGSTVVIEIADDGGGIDPERVRARALEAELIAPEQADHLSEQELLHLIFLPGFSTADAVTHLSGRGVGMDVVRANVEKLGGTVAVESTLGAGTTVRLKIPLTLAIIPALTVTSRRERYAIPQLSLLELLRLDGGVETIHGAPVYRHRGRLLPLVHLDAVLPIDAPPGAGNGGLNIVVLQAEEGPFGLVVEAIHDPEEIVVKPLPPLLQGLNVFAGATIRGDGRLALILDVPGLARRAGVAGAGREPAPAAHLAASTNGHHQLVLFSTGDGRQLALPLAQVARLEEFPRSSLEHAGTGLVVQYRDDVLPLLDLATALPSRRTGCQPVLSEDRLPACPTVQILVHAGIGRRVGLVVERIVDIVEEPLGARTRGQQPGILGTTVIRGRVTEVLDLDAILRPPGAAEDEELEVAPAGASASGRLEHMSCDGS